MNNHAATTGKIDQSQMAGAMAQGLTASERDLIKRRAYALWKEAGCPQGQDRHFWEQAELQILKGHPTA